MSITVYSVSGAPRAWRVLLGLTFKGLTYEVNLLQASKKEHKSTAYLKINPRGTIPSLTYKGIVIRDSMAILAWLDREFPEQPLFGETPMDAANIWQVTLEAADYLRKAVNDLFAPLLVQGESLPARGHQDWEKWQTLAKQLSAECSHLETLLTKHTFLAGDLPSAADAVCFPEICLIERAIKTKSNEMAALGLFSIFSDYPKLAKWKDTVSKLPNVDKTMPPHWIQC